MNTHKKSYIYVEEKVIPRWRYKLETNSLSTADHIEIFKFLEQEIEGQSWF